MASALAGGCPGDHSTSPTPGVDPAAGDEKVIGKPVHIRRGPRPFTFSARPSGKGDDQPFGAPANGAAEMEMGGGRDGRPAKRRSARVQAPCSVMSISRSSRSTWAAQNAQGARASLSLSSSGRQRSAPTSKSSFWMRASMSVEAAQVPVTRCAAAQARRAALVSSTVPKASMRRCAFDTRLPEPSAVVPLVAGAGVDAGEGDHAATS